MLSDFDKSSRDDATHSRIMILVLGRLVGSGQWVHHSVVEAWNGYDQIQSVESEPN